jgi:ketosteroid isomerase-like protein
MSAADESLIRRWADAINQRDLDALIEIAHPDIELHPLQFGVSGDFKGHDGVRTWVETFRDWDPGHQVRVESVKTLADGRVALFGTIVIEGEPSSPYALIGEVRDGKVAVMHSFPNDEDTLEKLGELG